MLGGHGRTDAVQDVGRTVGRAAPAVGVQVLVLAAMEAAQARHKDTPRLPLHQRLGL